MILGGGPVAAATALAMVQAGGLRHAELTLCYRKPPVNRPLGESLPPAARALFAELGVGQLLDDPAHVPCPGNLSVWGGDKPVANDFMLDVAGQGIHVDRRRLEVDLLREVAATGCTIHADHAVEAVHSTSQGYELALRTPAGRVTLTADFVIDATGQAAAFARRLPVARNVLDEVISLYAIVSVPSACRLPDYTMVEAVPEGWWYLSKLSGQSAYLALTTDKPALAGQSLGHADTWSQAYARCTWLTRMLPACVIAVGRLQQAPACSAILSRCVGRDWLAVGDAACSTDALMSAGVTRGIYQGMHAAQAMLAAFAGDAEALENYQDAVFAQFNRYLGLHGQLYGRERRFPDAGFWQRRQHALGG